MPRFKVGMQLIRTLDPQIKKKENHHFIWKRKTNNTS